MSGDEGHRDVEAAVLGGLESPAMEAVPTRLDAPPSSDLDPGRAPTRPAGDHDATPEAVAARNPAEPATLSDGPAPAGLASRRATLRFVFLVYFASRALLLLVALLDSVFQHAAFENELGNWDGYWYWLLSSHGYPRHVEHIQSTLGFFPLYPALMWLISRVTNTGTIPAGLIIAGFGGFIAVVLIERLCTRWWGETAGRRAVVLFCLFPGSIVFSMVYSEGVLIPLAAGCLLALESKRWLLAGVLAAFATAIGPDALAIVVACAVASFIELRRRGWRDPTARRSLIAPLLSPLGIVGFGLFLWRWTGSPFASFIAQHDGWGERTDAFALIRQAQTIAHELSATPFSLHNLNLNYVAGLLGALVLLAGLILLLLGRPRRIPAAAVGWTLGIAFLAVTSEYTPPNPRLLITAFPAVLVLAAVLRRRGFRICVVVNTLLLLYMSAVTFVGIALRP